MSAAHKSQRLKMNHKEERSSSESQALAPLAPATNGTANGHSPAPPGWTSSYPPELGFTAEEETRGPKELYFLLRKQIEWAEEDAEVLRKQGETMEELRRQEWMEKEILLEHVIEVDRDWHERRLLVLTSAAELPPAGAIRAAAMRESGSDGARSPGDGAAGSPGVVQPSSPSPMVRSEAQGDDVEISAGAQQD